MFIPWSSVEDSGYHQPPKAADQLYVAASLHSSGPLTGRAPKLWRAAGNWMSHFKIKPNYLTTFLLFLDLHNQINIDFLSLWARKMILNSYALMMIFYLLYLTFNDCYYFFILIRICWLFAFCIDLLILNWKTFFWAHLKTAEIDRRGPQLAGKDKISHKTQVNHKHKNIWEVPQVETQKKRRFLKLCLNQMPSFHHRYKYRPLVLALCMILHILHIFNL